MDFDRGFKNFGFQFCVYVSLLEFLGTHFMLSLGNRGDAAHAAPSFFSTGLLVTVFSVHRVSKFGPYST